MAANPSAQYMAERTTESVSLDKKFLSRLGGPVDKKFHNPMRMVGLPSPTSSHESVVRTYVDITADNYKTVTYGDDFLFRVRHQGHAHLCAMDIVAEWPAINAAESGEIQEEWVDWLGHAMFGNETDARRLTIRHGDQRTLREYTGTYLHLFTLLNLEAHTAESDRVREAAGEVGGQTARTTIVRLPLFGHDDIASLGNAFLASSTTRGFEVQFRLPAYNRLTRGVVAAAGDLRVLDVDRVAPTTKPNIYLRCHFADYTGPSRDYLTSLAYVGGPEGGIKRFILDNEAAKTIVAKTTVADPSTQSMVEIPIKVLKQPCAYLIVVQRFASDLLASQQVTDVQGTLAELDAAATTSLFNGTTNNPAADMFAFQPINSWSLWEANNQASPQYTQKSWSNQFFTLHGFKSDISLHKRVGIIPFCEDARSVNHATGSQSFITMNEPTVRLYVSEHANAVPGMEAGLYTDPALRVYDDLAGAKTYAVESGETAAWSATQSDRRFDVYSVTRNVYRNASGVVRKEWES